jgi:ABC-type branched-subunit amino acid transport system substrate-binding protein
MSATPQRGFPPGASWLAIAAVVGALLLASFTSVLPTFRSQAVSVDGSANGSAGGPSGTGGGPGGPSAGGTAGGSGGAPGTGAGAGTGGASGATGARGGAGSTGGSTNGSAACAAGRNGGNTDVGVSATSIKLRSTVAESGIAESFLGEVRIGMVAVTNQVNTSGGICGRRLDLQVVDDGWRADQGEADIRNFIADGAFALPVEPSSEGLNAASRGGDLDRAGIPVVGTDGMLISQYTDPMIWPVSTSTISTAHIAVQYAYAHGARSFGIAFNNSYKFGQEGEQAFKGAISRFSGAKLKADVGVTAGESDYSSDGSTFNNQCSGGCDVVFILMEPSTAEAWFATSGAQGGTKMTMGPQPLFVTTFGQNCGAPCNNMLVWTSYYPPQQPFVGKPAVQQYIHAVQSVSQSADVSNQFLEGGYDGMLLFVQALKQAGPALTRHALISALNSMSFDSGLTAPLAWHAGNHFANDKMLGFSIQYSQNFEGFRYEQTGYVTDSMVNLDH